MGKWQDDQRNDGHGDPGKACCDLLLRPGKQREGKSVCEDAKANGVKPDPAPGPGGCWWQAVSCYVSYDQHKKRGQNQTESSQGQRL
jgi:hypothetical protein